MMMQPNTLQGIRSALAQHGAAPGPSKLLNAEKDAAITAKETGLYTVYRSSHPNHPDFCTRVALTSPCFCGHALNSHTTKNMRPCQECACKAYGYISTRPEEVGESWLVRRKGFNVHTWRAKCRCKHGHDAHTPTPPRRCHECGCSGFQSDFLCVVCDLHWEEHVTVTETEAERRSAGLPVGDAFMPFAETPDIQDMFFRPAQKGPATIRPQHRSEPEKSVRLMPVNCGGRGLPLNKVASLSNNTAYHTGSASELRRNASKDEESQERIASSSKSAAYLSAIASMPAAGPLPLEASSLIASRGASLGVFVSSHGQRAVAAATVRAAGGPLSSARAPVGMAGSRTEKLHNETYTSSSIHTGRGAESFPSSSRAAAATSATGAGLVSASRTRAAPQGRFKADPATTTLQAGGEFLRQHVSQVDDAQDDASSLGFTPGSNIKSGGNNEVRASYFALGGDSSTFVRDSVRGNTPSVVRAASSRDGRALGIGNRMRPTSRGGGVTRGDRGM